MVKASYEKMGLKKGTWSKEEDKKLASYIQRFEFETWRTLPQKAGLLRCGKSCRFRWLNYLRPGIKRGNYSKEEEEIIIRLHKQLGNRWSEMAKKLPGRTDNEIKNYWHTHLRKRSNENQEMEETETQPSIGRCESNAYKQLLVTEDPSSDQMSPQSLSNHFTSNSGSSCTMSKAPTEVVVEQFLQSTTATEVDGSFSSQSLLEEIVSSQDSFLSTFEGLGPLFPLSPPSFVDYDYLGALCNTELDFSFNFSEGGEHPDIF